MACMFLHRSLAACTAMRLLEYIVRSPQKAALASPQKSVQAMCSRVQCVTFGEIPAAVSHKRSPTHEPLTDSVWSFFALRDPVPFETMAFVNEILQRRTPATSTGKFTPAGLGSSWLSRMSLYPPTRSLRRVQCRPTRSRCCVRHCSCPTWSVNFILLEYLEGCSEV